MTKIVTKTGWVYITLVLNWYSKKIVGYHIGIQSKNQDWLSALDMALQANFPKGVREYHLNLMSDNGSQPTSRKFMKNCKNIKINQVITSYNNPKGNADTERMMRTMKEECLRLDDRESFSDVETKVTIWINKYNSEYLHSASGWKPPKSGSPKNTK